MLFNINDIHGGNEPGEPVEASSAGEAALMALDRLGYVLEVLDSPPGGRPHQPRRFLSWESGGTEFRVNLDTKIVEFRDADIYGEWQEVDGVEES